MAAAEHASGSCIECGGWASLPAEDSCPRPRTRGGSGPLLGEMLVPRAPGGTSI